MAMKFQTFKVQFNGPFPLDMLRYDGCYPTTSHDVLKISESLTPKSSDSFAKSYGPRDVTLSRRVDRKSDNPTIGRWESFGCTVSNIEVR